MRKTTLPPNLSSSTSGLTESICFNPDDPEGLYFKYNGSYFEKDRPNRDWSRLPDIFSEALPLEVEEFERSSKK